MSLFGSILEKLGIRKAEAASKATAAVKPVAGTRPAGPPPRVTIQPLPRTGAVPIPTRPGAGAIPVVDVISKLTSLAASKPGLDWKVSIVDLLKLLGLDSSYKARKELAIELGCPAKLMEDSAAMNTWLHKTVLQKIAENGGNIPASLL